MGKKTAERLCVELGDKVSKFYSGLSEGEQVTVDESMGEEDNVRDALSALVNLGYPQNAAWQALRKVRQQQQAGDMKIEELIREALRVLA